MNRFQSAWEPVLRIDIISLNEFRSYSSLNKEWKAFYEENDVGISPSEYLQENPFTDITEMDIVRNYKQGIIPPSTRETLPMIVDQNVSVASRMRVGYVGSLFTLFYDVSDIYDKDLSTEHSEAGHPGNRSESCRKWWHERQTWQQVIVLDGVTVFSSIYFLLL